MKEYLIILLFVLLIGALFVVFCMFIAGTMYFITDIKEMWNEINKKK